MMNVAATHDSPRLSTSLYNKTMDKFKAKPSENPDYKINKPNELTRKEQILLIIHQFTFIGAPHIWNGDEVGMWGADDPDCRKPIVWDDLSYDDERSAYDPDKSRPVDRVSPDTTLRSFYKKLCRIRKENPVLVYGEIKFTIADDRKMVLAYRRVIGIDEIIVVFNRSDSVRFVKVPVETDGDFEDLLSQGSIPVKSSDKKIEIRMNPLSGIILRRSK
jgi:glycosidase